MIENTGLGIGISARGWGGIGLKIRAGKEAVLWASASTPIRYTPRRYM